MDVGVVSVSMVVSWMFLEHYANVRKSDLADHGLFDSVILSPNSGSSQLRVRQR